MYEENLLKNDVKIAPVQEDIMRCLVVMASVPLTSCMLTVTVGISLTAATFIVLQQSVQYSTRDMLHLPAGHLRTDNTTTRDQSLRLTVYSHTDWFSRSNN